MANIKELHLSHKESLLLFYSLKDFITTLKELAKKTDLPPCQESNRQFAMYMIFVLLHLNEACLPIILNVDGKTLSFINFTLIQFIQRNDAAASLFAAKIDGENAIENFTLHISVNMQALTLSKKIVNLHNQVQ